MSLSWLFQVKCSVSTPTGPATDSVLNLICSQVIIVITSFPEHRTRSDQLVSSKNWQTENKKYFGWKNHFNAQKGEILAGHATKSAVVEFVPFLAESCNISQKPCLWACWGKGSSSGDSRGSCPAGCGSWGPSWWRAAAWPPPSPVSSRSLKYRSWLRRLEVTGVTHESSRPRWLLPARSQKIWWGMFQPRWS